MYLRVPKKYQARKRPRRYLFSKRWLWLWILTPLVVIAGQLIYEQRDTLSPQVVNWIEDRVGEGVSGVATMIAPSPMPTTNPAPALRDADNAWQAGAIEQATSIYAQIIENVPNDAQAHYRYTLGLLLQGRDAAALAAAETALTADPFSADLWAVYGLALARNDRPVEAIPYTLRAQALAPDSARARAFRAEAYLDANQPSRATDLAEEAIEINPESYEAHYVLGLINNYSNFDREAARIDFETAYTLAPNMPDVKIELGWVEWALDNDADAELMWEEVESDNPQNLDALYALGFFSNSVVGDANRAIDYLQRCVALDPGNIACLSYMGIVQFNAPDVPLEDAVETYEQLMRTGTTNPAHYLSAGRVFIADNNCSAAGRELRRGYNLEQARPIPDTALLGDFEAELLACGESISPQLAGAPTPPPLAEP
ncbi:MAG: tetratricopeptide repeat protein [Chloroflexi bacterium]|nr:tetratricopeptide repeat protein [Chloroflexota bacterium]